MQEKFKILLILLLFISFQSFSQEENKSLVILKNIDDNSSDYSVKLINYLSDIAEVNIIDNYSNIDIRNVEGSVDSTNLKRIINFVFSNGISAFYHISLDESDDEITINVNFYNSIGNLLFEDKILIEKNYNLLISDVDKDKWIKLINYSLDILISSKDVIVSRKRLIRKNIDYQRDYPFFSIGLTSISVKIYFDDRINNRSQKIFSTSPLDIRLSFYPLKYLEVGAFCRMDFNNMVFSYYDINKEKYDYFDSTFTLYYGFYIGISIFKNDMHYGIGLQVYNLYYDLSQNSQWKKTQDYRSSFLPQFALYQRLDFKIFKILYFSMFFLFKTTPMFELNNKEFYSRPFHYDFFVIEFSFVGLSLFF